MNPVEASRARKSATLSLPRNRWSVRIATVFGLGFMKSYHPYINAALITTLLIPFAVWPLVEIGGPAAAMVVCMVSTLLGHLALTDIEKHGTESDHDAKCIVIDEVAGASLTATMLPALWELTHATTLADHIAAVLFVGAMFRFFDVYKPFPANRVDVYGKTPFSVMGDDLIAGAYAAILAIVFFWFTSLI